MTAGPLLPPGVRGRIVRRTVVAPVAARPVTGPSGGSPVTGPGGASPVTRLAVVEIGPAHAPAWLLAPGAGSSAHVVAGAFAGPVCAAGGRLVTYDLRGHGASGPAPDPADHHLDVVTGDLAAVAASTGGDIEVVGGISLGGHAAVRAVAAGLLAVRPSAVLACLPAFAEPVPAGHGVHAAIAATAVAHGVEGLLDGARQADGLPRWLRTAVLRDQARHDPASLVAALWALDGADAPTDAERRELGLPLGVVGWPDDPGHPLPVAERWAASAGRAALVTITMAALEAGLERLGLAGRDAIARAMR